MNLLTSQLIHELNPAKILLIRLARLGDVILLVPAIKALRKKFPGAHIAALVGHRCAPILEMCSAVDEVVAVNRVAMRDGSTLTAVRDIFKLAERLRKSHYDLVLDFHSFRETNLLAWYSQATWRLGLKRANSSYLSFCFNLDPVAEDKSEHAASVFLSLLRPLGITQEANDISLDLLSEDLAKADDFLRQHKVTQDSLLLGLNVGAGSPGRIWSKEKFASLAGRLIRQFDATAILFSGPQDSDFSKQVADLMNVPRLIIANQCSLRALAAMMSRCKILVSNDTGPMHLGPAVGVPTLGLFSLGYPENYRPLGPFSRFLKKQPIEALEVDEVFGNVLEIMNAVQKEESLQKARRVEFGFL